MLAPHFAVHFLHFHHSAAAHFSTAHSMNHAARSFLAAHSALPVLTALHTALSITHARLHTALLATTLRFARLLAAAIATILPALLCLMVRFTVLFFRPVVVVVMLCWLLRKRRTGHES